MSKIIKYFLSKISVEVRRNNYDEYSFERVTNEIYEKFQNLKTKKLYLGDVMGKHSDITVEYDESEWKLIEITDVNSINAIWDYLPHYERIQQCIDEYDENNEK